MKRLLLAVGLAVAFHVLALGLAPYLLPKRPPIKGKQGVVSLTLTQLPTPKAPVKEERPAPVPSPQPLPQVTKEAPEIVRPEVPEVPLPEAPVQKRPQRREKKPQKPVRKRATPDKPEPIQAPKEEIMQAEVPGKDEPQAAGTLPETASLSGAADEDERRTGPVPAEAGASLHRSASDAARPAGPPVGSSGVQEQIVKARPRYAQNPPPAYPQSARRRGYEGTVTLEVLVGEKGEVTDLRVWQSSGHSLLDRAALQAVKEWVFEPGKKGEKPVEMWVRVPVRFELN